MPESNEKTTPDTGDRVVISSEGTITGFGGQSLKQYCGQHGVILQNDGWGCCSVRLDSGRIVIAWNGADLTLESEYQNG